MAVPSADRTRRPFLLSLSLFLLISAILVLLFLFLDPSTGSLAFLPSRLSASAPSLAPPLLPQQQNHDTPRSRSPPHSRPDGSSATVKAEDSGPSASQPVVTKADANSSASEPSTEETSVSPGVGDNSDARGVGADGRTDTSVAPVDDEEVPPVSVRWQTCSRLGRGVSSTDYIPCLDNVRAIKALRSRRHMEHRERHCPLAPRPRCLVPLPAGYRTPVPWPRSRDMIWYNNVPHPKLVEYKKDQNWVTRSGDYLVFPGGGTQFKDGVGRYIQFVEQIMPAIQWGRRTRTALDVGCGVASFGGYLLDRNVITMSFAPKDEHEAQIQFALERGIPAFLAVIGTQKLPFPDNTFDVVHCARCRVHWYANGGKPLLELNRVLRPGGYFIWSATPVYRQEKRDQDDWTAMVTLTKSICWRTVVKSQDVNGIGVVIYQKPASNSCYAERKTNEPPLCSKRDGSRFPCIWYWLPKESMSTISDQKKRTLEALQQQYTAAKAKKLQDEQVKSQKKSNFSTPRPKFDTPRKGKGPEITPLQTYAQPSPHKGVAFSSSKHQQKPSASSGEEINPVYAELSCAFHGNLSKDGVSDLDGTEVVHSVIYDIIQKGGDSGKITKGAKKLKLEKGILLDNFVQRGPRLVDAQARSLLIHSKRSKRHMSLKQHKKCGSFDLDGTFHRYDFYKPMHEMWKDYIRELMKVTPKKKLSENLLSADLHGALLIVAECKAASYQGVNGIMIRDTAETFGIISEDNRFRVVPKAGSVFILQADCWKVTLIGDKLSPREKLKEEKRQHRVQSIIR